MQSSYYLWTNMDMWMCTYDKGPQTLISYLHTKTCIYNTSNIRKYKYTINVHIIDILISNNYIFLVLHWPSYHNSQHLYRCASPWSSRWSDTPRVWSPVDRESLTHACQGTRFANDLQIVGNLDLLRLKNKNLCIMYGKSIEVLIDWKSHHIFRFRDTVTWQAHRFFFQSESWTLAEWHLICTNFPRKFLWAEFPFRYGQFEGSTRWTQLENPWTPKRKNSRWAQNTSYKQGEIAQLKERWNNPSETHLFSAIYKGVVTSFKTGRGPILLGFSWETKIRNLTEWDTVWLIYRSPNHQRVNFVHG